MRRMVAMLALVALAACSEPRHLWPLEMGDIALHTAVFAILEARAVPARETTAHKSTPTEPRTQRATVDESDAPAPAEQPAPPAASEPPPAYQEETAEELPRNDDELTADMEDEDAEAAEEEAAEQEQAAAEQERVAAEQLAQARRLQAMQLELLAVEEQLRQQYDVNVAVAAELIIHTHRLIYTQLVLAALLDNELRR